jgi:hypothetical protein
LEAICASSIFLSFAFSLAFARLSNCSCVNCFLTFGAGASSITSSSSFGSSIFCYEAYVFSKSTGIDAINELEDDIPL